MTADTTPSLVERLTALSTLEDGWYANVGRKTAEACCTAMREAAAMIPYLHDRLTLTNELVNKERARAEAAEANARRLSEALRPFANLMPDTFIPSNALEKRIQEWAQIARAALTTKEADRIRHVDDLNDPVLIGLANLKPGQCPLCLCVGTHKAGCEEADRGPE